MRCEKHLLGSAGVSVRPSFCVYDVGSQWTDFREIWQGDLPNICRENPSLLKSKKNTGHFT
jgi:hypothetical protein